MEPLNILTANYHQNPAVIIAYIQYPGSGSDFPAYDSDGRNKDTPADRSSPFIFFVDTPASISNPISFEYPPV